MNRNIDHTGQNPTLPFAGVNIPVTYTKNQPRIILRYVFTDLGLDPGSALQRIKGKRWADLKFATAIDGRGHHTQMQTLSTGAFLIWISRLTYVNKETRPQLDAYQAAVHELLTTHSTEIFPQDAA